MTKKYSTPNNFSFKFYLTSKENRQLYPSNRYPITHSINRQTVQHETSQKLGEFQNFMPIIYAALFWSILFSLCLDGHVKIYNAAFGPFHLSLDEFVEHIEKSQRGRRLREYIQVELGQGNIQNPAGSHETIRQYLNPETRRPHLHTATYKYLKKPSIYVKLPTRHVRQVHTKFPFDFDRFSLETLKCISNTLLSKTSKTSAKPKKLKEKSEMINFIEKEYSRNSTSFNMLILTKCGILIGYLYKPLQKEDRAFIPRKEHFFVETDIALDASVPYFSIFSYQMFHFVLFICSISFVIYYYSIYVIYYHFLSFPLRIENEIKKQLKVLNFKGPLHEQLFKLDRMIANSQHQFKNQIFVIRDDSGRRLFVLLPESREKIRSFTKSSPFMVYEISRIRSVQTEGIYCLNDRFHESQIKWPTTSKKEKKKFAEWFHQKLMEISDGYRTLVDREELRNLTHEEEIQFAQRHPWLYFLELHPNWFGFLSNRIDYHPLPARQIAIFRLQHSRNPTLVDEAIQNQPCSICQEKFVLNEEYSIWPCPSNHFFHFDCILDQFRTNNSCPNCRGQARF